MCIEESGFRVSNKRQYGNSKSAGMDYQPVLSTLRLRITFVYCSKQPQRLYKSINFSSKNFLRNAVLIE